MPEDVPHPQQCRIAVVGGGITGLAAAHHLVELAQHDGLPLQVTLFEARDHVGGAFGSEQRGEYLIERGADSFITNKPAGLALCERLGLGERLIPTDSRFRRSLILFRGKPVETPAGFQLVAPDRLWPVLTTPWLSLGARLRTATEVFSRPRKQSNDESVADFVRRHFGSEMFERIIQPLVGGIYTSDPEKLSAQATLPNFVELERQYGSLVRGLRRSRAQKDGKGDASGARYSLFVAPRGGMQEIHEALLTRLTGSAIVRLSTPVTGISQGGGWTLSTPGGQPERFDGLILAVSAERAAILLAAVHGACAARLSAIPAASSAIVITGHRLKDFQHPLDAFGLVIPRKEGRRILAVSFLSRKFPGRAPEDHIILRTFVGGALQPEEFDRSDKEMICTVLAELHSIFGLSRDPNLVEVARYPRGMPQYTLGHLERVAQIERAVGELPRLALAGNYLQGVGVPDCIASGESAAASLWARVKPTLTA